MQRRPHPTVSDLWQGTARVELDPQSFGAAHNIHFISPLWDQGRLNAYYIRSGSRPGSYATGLAVSPDGVTFSNEGRVLDVGGGWQWAFGPTEFSHQIGRADGEAWAANTAQDAPGYLTFGPYVTTLPRGENTVSFLLEIDNNDADNLTVVTIEINDATAQKKLATRNIRRREFAEPFEKQVFSLDYTQELGNRIEFRVYWYDRAFIRFLIVGVSQGVAPWFDQRMASFPDVWKQDGTYYMVYEGAGIHSSLPGDIGLATSSDGLNWIKHHENPILKHQSTGWESFNIGTPSLWYEGGAWYLFYHGFNRADCQIGVATGASLDALTRHPNNPIIKVGANGQWDSGTCGVRSIVKEGAYYYMVYEGSTDPPYGEASWSSGMARSTDLISWTKFSDNPVLPTTGVGMGYDGPCWLRTPDGAQHIYYRRTGPNATYRGTLVWI